MGDGPVQADPAGLARALEDASSPGGVLHDLEPALAPRRVQDGTGTDAQVAQHWRERALKAEAQRDKALGVVEAGRKMVAQFGPHRRCEHCGWAAGEHDPVAACAGFAAALATFDAKPTDSEGER